MNFRSGALAAPLMAALSLPALAGGVNGEWANVDGRSRVRFAQCGDAVCGVISWLKDPTGSAKVGQKVYFDMKPSGDDAWAGSAFNPEDGKTYSGKMTLSGDTLSTAGCVLGGLICKSVDWTRAH